MIGPGTGAGGGGNTGNGGGGDGGGDGGGGDDFGTISYLLTIFQVLCLMDVVIYEVDSSNTSAG